MTPSGIPVGQKRESVAHVDIVKEARAAVEAGGGPRRGRVGDVQDAQAAAHGVHHQIGVVPLQPGVVDARFEAGREAADDPRMGRVGQVEERDPVASALAPFSAQPITLNGAGAVNRGIELAGAAVPADGLRLRGSWSYTRAELGQDSPGLLEGGADAFRGDRLSGAPQRFFIQVLVQAWIPLLPLT